MNEAALLRAIQEAPDDDGPRLAYADWREENGDGPRGEFIRVQCALAAMDEDDARRTALEDQERALRKAHGSAWSAPLKPFSLKFAFRRGFPDEVLVQPEAFLDHAKEVFRAAPVFALRFRSSKDHVATLANCPWLERLSSLSLYFNHLGIKRAETFFASPHLHRLAALDLRSNDLRPAGLKALLKARLSGLRSLNLLDNKLGDTGVELLAASPLLGQLRRLILDRNEITETGVRALAESPHAAGLTELHLGQRGGLSEGGAAALADSPSLRRLTRLELRLRGDRRTPGEHDLTRTGLRRLVESPTLAALTTLILDHQQLKDQGVQALAETSGLQRLTTLSLLGCRFGEAGMATLAGSPLLRRLRSLNLAQNDFTAAGAAALARSPHFVGLRSLDLSSTSIGDEGAKVLAAAPGAASLRHLDLTSCEIGPAGAAALAASPYLADLRTLRLRSNAIGDEGTRALAESPGLGRLTELAVTWQEAYAVTGYPTKQGLAALVGRFGKDVVRLER